jgi:hypothetical protein
MLSDQPDILPDQPDILSDQPDMLSDQPDILSDQPGVLSDQMDIIIDDELTEGLPEEAADSITGDELPGDSPEEAMDIVIDIDDELLQENEVPDISEEPAMEDSPQPEAALPGEGQDTEEFEDSIVLDEPELDELEGEHTIDAGSSNTAMGEDSFDSQEFDVSFEPTLEEETDELASSDAEIEEDTGLRETDFEDVNVDDLTLDKDVISLDFTEDDLSDIGEDLDADEVLNSKDAEELQLLREEGAKPMTEAPEDTSYLEEDPLAEEQIDLSGAVIDEPDLSGDITENPVQEPSLENISLDLDLENLDDTFESEELKPEEESFAQVIPEGFVVEPDDSQSMSSLDTDEPFEEEDLDTLDGDQGGEDVSPEPPAVKEEEATESAGMSYIPSNIKHELKTVLSYMDQLLESLPEEKIEEFAKSEYFETYKKLFEELGLV